MKILFYCHNGLGIGHLARTFKLANALTNDHSVAVICGGWLPESFELPKNIELFRLPVVSMTRDGKLKAEDENITLASVMSRRAEQVVNCARQISPDVLIVEMFPFGRKQFAQEIIGLIDAVSHTAKVLASVRDVLVSRPENQHRYDTRAVDWLNQYFDGLMIHSDPDVISLAETFTAYERIEVPIHYTGYVAPPSVERSDQSQQVAVVSAGGGRVGQKLLDVASRASNLLKQRTGLNMLIVNSPKRTGAMSDPLSPECQSIGFVNDLAGLLGRSMLSISQCGYNTATDVLAAGVPAVFVPFETPKEDEQIHRARRFSTHQRSVCVREIELCPQSLVAAAENALTQRSLLDVNLNGVAQSADVIKQYLRPGNGC